MSLNVDINIDTENLLNVVKQVIARLREEFLEGKREENTETKAERKIKQDSDGRQSTLPKSKNGLYEAPFVPEERPGENFLNKTGGDWWGMGWLYIQKTNWELVLKDNGGFAPDYSPRNITIDVWSGDKSKKSTGTASYPLFEESLLYVLPVKEDRFIVSLIGFGGSNLSFLVSNDKVKTVKIPESFAVDILADPEAQMRGKIGWLLQGDGYMYPPSQQQLSIEEEVATFIPNPRDPYDYQVNRCNNGPWADQMPKGFILGSPAVYWQSIGEGSWSPGLAYEQGMNSPPLYLSEKSSTAWANAEGGPPEETILYQGENRPSITSVRPARTYGLFTKNASGDYIVEAIQDEGWRTKYYTGEVNEGLTPGRPAPLARRVSPSGTGTVTPTLEFKRRLFWQFTSDFETGTEKDENFPPTFPGPGGKPASAIAVIDEDDNYTNCFRTQDWITFRYYNPDDRIIVIRPLPAESTFTLPGGWDGEVFEMSRGERSKWFEWAFPDGPVKGWMVRIFLDSSGSVDSSDWGRAYAAFSQECEDNNILIQEIIRGSEQWLYPFAFGPLGRDRPPGCGGPEEEEETPNPDDGTGPGDPTGTGSEPEPNWDNPMEVTKYTFVDDNRARFFMLLSNPWSEDWSERLQSAGLSESSLEF